jgi:uncharacterized protein (TIGR02996 family)
MASLDELLRTIYANPDDDGPRLVYADWLTEKGDPRGEFIQLSCNIASRGPADPEWSDPASDLVRQAERAKALEAKHAKTWLAPVRQLMLGWQFERGFLARARVKMRRFLGDPAALIEASPRLDLSVSGFEAKLLGQFCAAPLGKLGSLTLASAKLSDESARLLASSPTLTGLRGLRLEGVEISLAGLATLVDSPHLLSLEELALTYQKGTYGDGVIEVLARKRLGALRRLELEGIGCTAATAAAIAREGVFASKVEQLSLAHNPIGDEGLRALMASRQLDRLAWLSVYDCGVSEKVGLEIARSKGLPRALTRISLEASAFSRHHKWSEAACAAFLERFPKTGSEPPSLYPRTGAKASTPPKAAKPGVGSAKTRGEKKPVGQKGLMTLEEAQKAAMRYAKSKGFKSSLSTSGPVKGLWGIRLSVWAPGVSSNITVYFDPKTHEFARVDTRKMPSFPK